MPGDGEGTIGLDQKPEGTGKPDRPASSPRHRVGVAGWDSTPCTSRLGKNNASGADRVRFRLDCRQPEVGPNTGFPQVGQDGQHSRQMTRMGLDRRNHFRAVSEYRVSARNPRMA
jgi:hypothetical protein